MKRKLITLFLSILTVITVASAFTVTANAASKSVTLTTDDKWVYSETISAKGAKAKVCNAASSNHDVYGIIQYKSGSSYVSDQEYLIAKGKTLSKDSATYFMANKAWRLELNPYGVATKGCTADGTISSR